MGAVKMTDLTISASQVREWLDYDPETGVLTWRPRGSERRGKSWTTRYAGKDASQPRKDGYRSIGVNYKNYLAHRIAWLHFHGKWPEHNLDHINNIRDDNRIENLRDVTDAVNAQNLRSAKSNNKSGFLGVVTDKKSGKYRAQVKKDGVVFHLGSFTSPEVAHACYLEAKRSLHEGCMI